MNSQKYRSGLPFALALLFLGMATLCWGTSAVLGAAGNTNWPATEGVVLRAEVEETTYTRRDSNGVHTSRTVYTPKIEYGYTVDGQDYTNTAIGSDVSEIRSGIYAGQYAPGNPITVYYNPKDPSKAVLSPGLSWGVFAPCGLGLILSVLGGGLAVQERRRQRRNRGTASNAA